eukprot:COSAG04_NODE_1531_length_6449_cov_3.075276_6_plen_25_part_01
MPMLLRRAEPRPATRGPAETPAALP